MKSKIKVITFLICVAALPYANASQSDTLIYGFGTASCGKYLDKSRKNDWMYRSYISWVLGYLTGYQSGNRLRLRNVDTEAIAAYLQKHCSESPLDNLLSATESLAQELE